MEELHSLIHSLTSSEWNALQIYLTAFTPHDAATLKYARLAALLHESDTAPSKQYCCIKLYGNKNANAIEMLKYRLKEKVLDFLVTDISIDKKKDLDEMDYMIIKIKKKSIQFQQLFYSKKRMQLVFVLLDEIIFLAKKYEYFIAVVEHLRLKKTWISFKKGKEEFEKINKDMGDYLFRFQLANKAEHYYYELSMQNEYSGRQDKQRILLFLKQTTAEIRNENALIKSPTVNYYLKVLEIEFFQLQGNYSKAKSVCLELLDVVRNNKSVYRRQRVGVVYDNLSRCEFYLSNYAKAAEYPQKAQMLFRPKSENYCIACEQEFYALFAMKQYDKAADAVSKMLTSADRKELGEFRFAKYNFLYACLLFSRQSISR